MNLFQDLDTTYQHLAHRPRPTWLAQLCNGELDDMVATIRDTRRDTTASDRALRALIGIGRQEPDALTVAMYALVPQLRARLGRTVTDEYRHDVLTDLAFVMLDSALDGPRLANRLVNRAHNRTYKAAQRVHSRGAVHVTTITPQDPGHLARHAGRGDDVATVVSRRVDLTRFHTAICAAIDDGTLSERAWAAYRDHRLRRALDVDDRVCTSHERTTASRTARKLEPLISKYLHAAQPTRQITMTPPVGSDAADTARREHGNPWRRP